MRKTAIAIIAGIVLLSLFVLPAAVSAYDDFDWDEIEESWSGLSDEEQMIGAALLAAAAAYDYDATPAPTPTSKVIIETYHETVYEPVYVTSYSPSYGYLYVNSNPDGCSLYVDGRYQGKTPITVTLETGRHSVSLAKSGYDEYSTTVGINTGSETTIYPSLYKKVSEGYLSVNSNPSGADVYINSNYRGTTPLTLYLSSGTYDVIVKKPGYKPYSSSVSVRDGKTSTLSASLQSDTSYGYVTVLTSPGGAAVYVDGAYFGTTPVNGAGLTLGPYTSATSHTVMVTVDGYASQSQSFSVSSGQTKTLQFTLQKDQNAKGSVAVSSSPSGAYIYIDNLFYGMTPATIPGLEKGSHILKLSAAGYNDYQDTFTVNAGENLQKSVAMSPASGPVPASTPLPAAGLLAGLLAAGVLFTLKRK